MFATISITPQELERLALPKHRAELRRFLQILGERQASLLPVDYRGQWIDHLDACVRRLPRGDGVAPSPLKIVERLREAGPVYLETGRWDAAIEQPDEWWGEIEAGYNARSHDAFACQTTRQNMQGHHSNRMVVAGAGNAGNATARQSAIPELDVQQVRQRACAYVCVLERRRSRATGEKGRDGKKARRLGGGGEQEEAMRCVGHRA